MVEYIQVLDSRQAELDVHLCSTFSLTLLPSYYPTSILGFGFTSYDHPIWLLTYVSDECKEAASGLWITLLQIRHQIHSGVCKFLVVLADEEVAFIHKPHSMLYLCYVVDNPSLSCLGTLEVWCQDQVTLWTEGGGLLSWDSPWEWLSFFTTCCHFVILHSYLHIASALCNTYSEFIWNTLTLHCGGVTLVGATLVPHSVECVKGGM